MVKSFLGIDYGRVRIGLALSENGLIARPLETFINKGLKKNFRVLSGAFVKYNVGSVIIGLPLNADGSESVMALEVRAFGKKLESMFGVDVAFFDERYTSIDAEDFIRFKLGITDRGKIAQLIDSVAACMILQDYLKENYNGF